VRKTVTVMFADLVGSTTFGESVDAEAARHELSFYYELCQSVVERHKGTVAKYMGDGIMAIFGVPEVAADDAEQAVRAALDLQHEFVSLGQGIRERHDSTMGLRIGVNTGEIVIDEGDVDLVGDAINVAARIEAQCTPGEVLVGEQTWRLTRSRVDYEVLGEVSLRGKTNPVATFRAIQAVEDEQVTTPFVGRSSELSHLSTVLHESIADNTVRLATVIGEPGVGKTRLATQLASEMSDGTAFHLRIDSERTATFEPIGDLLRAVTGLSVGAREDRIVEAVAALVAEQPDADRLSPLLAGFLGASPSRSTEEALWGCRRLIEILASTGPLVVTVDDVQWATPLFLDLLEHLVEWARGPVLLLALARPEFRDLRPALVETGRRVAACLSLEGLDSSTTAALAEGILGAPLPNGLSERLPVSTEGNPLFVREFIRMLIDDGTLTERSNGWALTVDAAAIDIPPTITSLLAVRVERLDEEERRVAEKAAVVGSEFTRGAVAALLPDIGTGRLDRILERLRRQEIVDPTGWYWGDEPQWRFHHALIRDAAYRRLLKERRAELHQQVAEWTTVVAADLAEDAEISIAFHYERAHEYLTQLGSPTKAAIDVGGRAADLLTVAAQRALDEDDLLAAGALTLRALARLLDDDHRRAELSLIGCEAFFSAAHVAEGLSLFEELAAHRGLSARMAAWTAAFEGQLVVFTAPERLDEMEPSVAAAASALADLGDQAGVAKARLVRALILARQGRVAACEAELDAALEAARAAGDRRRITAVLAAAPIAALWGPSPVARAGGRCLDIVRLLRITTGSPLVEATSLRCQAVLDAMRGRFDEARHLIARSREIADEIGLRHGVLETAMFAGYIDLLAEDYEAAEESLTLAHTGLGQLGIGADAGQAEALLARALLAQGRVEDAERHAKASEANAGRNLQTAIASRAARAEIEAALGHRAEAELLAREAVAIAAGTDLTMDHAVAAQTLARVLSEDETTARSENEKGTPFKRAQADAERLFEAKGAVAVSDRHHHQVGAAATTTSVELYVSNNMAAIRDRSLEAWTALHRSDFLFVSHRPGMPVAEVDRDLAAQSAIDLSDTFDGAISSETIANITDRIGVFRITWGTAASAEMVWVSVFEVDEDDRAIRAATFEEESAHEALACAREWGLAAVKMVDAKVVESNVFEVDDAETALARFAELAEPSLANLASQSCERFWDRVFRDLDVEGALDLVSSDAVSIDRRRLVASPVLDRAGVRTFLELLVHPRNGLTDYSVAIVDTRGERLALARITASDATGGWREELLQLYQVDAAGQIDRVASFSPEDLGLATEELDDQARALADR